MKIRAYFNSFKKLKLYAKCILKAFKLINKAKFKNNALLKKVFLLKAKAKAKLVVIKAK